VRLHGDEELYTSGYTDESLDRWALELGGWLYRHDRDLTGFIDGTENPSLLEAPRWRSAGLMRATAGVLALFYGCVLVIGAALSDYGPLQPLVSAGLVASASDARASDAFQVVSNEADLDKAIELGRRQGKSIMVDFSADWCTECRLMERNIFAQDAVRQQLRDLLLIRADLTHFDTSSKKLMRRFAVVGPPTVVFLNPDGREITDARVVGDVGVSGFLNKLAKASRV